MKKGSIVVRYFVVLVLIATFVACASTPKQEGAGEYVDDSVITTRKNLCLPLTIFSSPLKSVSKPTKASCNKRFR